MTEHSSRDTHTKTGGVRASFTTEGAVELDPACAETYKLLKIRRRFRYIIYTLEHGRVIIEKTAPPEATFEEFKRDLPFSTCRWAVFDFAYTTYDGRPTNKLFFLVWAPQNATIEDKMAFTHGKHVLRDAIDGVIDASASEHSEVADAFGLTPASAAAEESDEEF